MGNEGGEGYFDFLDAGLRQMPQPKSISTLEVENVGDEIVVDSDADDGGEAVEGRDQVERLASEKEGAIVRKLIDPKLPSEQEVLDHYRRGNLPYRNWCHICGRAKGTDMRHQKEGWGGKDRKAPEYHFGYCFSGDEVGLKLKISV